jgi:hypothetical protein
MQQLIAGEVVSLKALAVDQASVQPRSAAFRRSPVSDPISLSDSRRNQRANLTLERLKRLSDLPLELSK